MAEISTDSYPKPAALPVQKSVLDQVNQFQHLESQNLTINAQKLKQINDQFGLMNNELATLANDPSITKDKAAERLTTFAKTYGFKPEVTNHMLQELNSASDVPTFARTAISRGMQTQEKVNNLYGTPGVMSNGQTDTPVMTSPMIAGGRPTATQLPIQRQIPPNAEVRDAEGRPTLQGPTPAIAAPGTVAGPGQLPVQRVPTQATQQQPTLPVAPRSDTGVTPQGTPVSQIMTDRYPAPSGPNVGMSPLFEEGKKAYTAAQQNAAAKMLAAKPAIQALPLMQSKGFLSGPGTEGFTKAVAALKGWGLLDTANENDPTAIRQEVSKKLAQYVSNSPVGQRSDAAQVLKEASSPNPKAQILPALMKLTKDAVALDRVEAALPNSFKDKDYSKFIEHQGKFPQSIDEKAFTLDLEPEEKSKELVDKMAKQLQSTNRRDAAQADKFFKSLRIAKEQGFYQ